jgi:hypothetical protein
VYSSRKGVPRNSIGLKIDIARDCDGRASELRSETFGTSIGSRLNSMISINNLERNKPQFLDQLVVVDHKLQCSPAQKMHLFFALGCCSTIHLVQSLLQGLFQLSILEVILVIIHRIDFL